MTLADQVDRYVRERPFKTLTLHALPDGRFQANLEGEQRGSWRIRVEATPSAALAALFAEVADKPTSASVFE